MAFCHRCGRTYKTDTSLQQHATAASLKCKAKARPEIAPAQKEDIQCACGRHFGSPSAIAAHFSTFMKHVKEPAPAVAAAAILSPVKQEQDSEYGPAAGAPKDKLPVRVKKEAVGVKKEVRDDDLLLALITLPTLERELTASALSACYLASTPRTLR